MGSSYTYQFTRGIPPIVPDGILVFVPHEITTKLNPNQVSTLPREVRIRYLPGNSSTTTSRMIPVRWLCFTVVNRTISPGFTRESPNLVPIPRIPRLPHPPYHPPTGSGSKKHWERMRGGVRGEFQSRFCSLDSICVDGTRGGFRVSRDHLEVVHHLRFREE